jgi:hypothetical protein
MNAITRAEAALIPTDGRVQLNGRQVEARAGETPLRSPIAKASPSPPLLQGRVRPGRQLPFVHGRSPASAFWRRLLSCAERRDEGLD